MNLLRRNSETIATKIRGFKRHSHEAKHPSPWCIGYWPNYTMSSEHFTTEHSIKVVASRSAPIMALDGSNVMGAPGK